MSLRGRGGEEQGRQPGFGGDQRFIREAWRYRREVRLLPDRSLLVVMARTHRAISQSGDTFWMAGRLFGGRRLLFARVSVAEGRATASR